MGTEYAAFLSLKHFQLNRDGNLYPIKFDKTKMVDDILIYLFLHFVFLYTNRHIRNA